MQKNTAPLTAETLAINSDKRLSEQPAGSPRFLTAFDNPIAEQIADFRSNQLGTYEKTFKLSFAEWTEHVPNRSKWTQLEKAIAKNWNQSKNNKKKISDFHLKVFMNAEKSGFDLKHVSDLYGDIKELRKVTERSTNFDIAKCLSDANRSILKGVLSRSLFLEFRLQSNIKTFIKLAKWRGLMIEAMPVQGEHCHFKVSGPLSLFTQTSLYTNSLLALFAVLAWDAKFEAWALTIAKDGSQRILRIGAFEGLKSGKKPRTFDSKIEKAFFRDFQLATTDWKIQREPDEWKANQHSVFPDFAVTHAHLGQKVYIEIVGFWTPEYLEKKSTSIKELNRKDLLLCIAKPLVERGFDFVGLEVPVVIYEKNIDPKIVIETLKLFF